MTRADQRRARAKGGGGRTTQPRRRVDAAEAPEESPLEGLRRRARMRMATSTLLAAVGVLAGLCYVLWPEFTGRPSTTPAAFGQRLLSGLCLTVAACSLAALFAWSAIARYIRHRRSESP